MDPDTVELAADSLPNLWDFAHPKESGEQFMKFQDRAIAHNQPVLAALAGTQHARAMGLLRRFEDGLAMLDSIDLSQPDPSGELLVRMKLERGRLLNSSGKRSESVPEFEQAWGHATDANLDGLAVDAAHMLGIVLDGEDGKRWNQRAMELAMSSQQSAARKWRGSLLNNIAWDLHDDGQYAQALNLFKDALEVRFQEEKPDPIRIAQWSIGRCLRSLERYDEAIQIQRQLETDPNTDGYVVEEIGECLLATGHSERARLYFAKAYAMLSSDPWLVANESERLERLRQLGA